jgi:hypothetical protein
MRTQGINKPLEGTKGTQLHSSDRVEKRAIVVRVPHAQQAVLFQPQKKNAKAESRKRNIFSARSFYLLFVLPSLLTLAINIAMNRQNTHSVNARAFLFFFLFSRMQKKDVQPRE